MELRLLSVGARGFFSHRFATRLRGFASQFCHLQREKTSGTQGIVWEHFLVSLYETKLNNDTVEIVLENWEVAYFYRENEASIFDAKIEINLFSAKLQFNMQVGRHRAKWKVLHYKKEMDK